MKAAGAILLTLLLAGTVSAISLYYGELEGKIMDESGKALSGVIVTAELLPAGAQTQSLPQSQTTTARNSQTAKSGKNGAYKFVALRPGFYRVRFNLTGHQAMEKTVEIKQSINNTINIVLTPSVLSQ